MKQRKALSQVFLKTPEPCTLVVSQLDEAESVLEIGCGPGILTNELLAAGKKVTAIDLDARWLKNLNHENLTTHCGSVLSFDLEAWCKTPGSKAVCGNIPYHISTAILNWLLPHLGELTCAVLMVQKEFAERMSAAPGRKAYGALSVYCQLRAELELFAVVSRHLFTPVPKVDSALVKLTAKSESLQLSSQALKNCEKVTKTAFSKRRKTLRNSLKPFDPFPCSFDLNERCENLSPKDFLQLSQEIFNA